MVDAVRSLSPPGRFLKKCPNSKWEDVGDEIAREKTSQVLRDAIQSKKSFSGDTPARIPVVDRKRIGTQGIGTGQQSQPSRRSDQAMKREEPSSPMETTTARAPPSPYRVVSQQPFASYSSSSTSHHRTPSSVGTAPRDWTHSHDRPRYHQPVSADSMDSTHDRAAWWNHHHQNYHQQYYAHSFHPYGYQPSGQYPVTPAAAAHPASAPPRKRQRHQQMAPLPPSMYDYSPEQHYHSLHAANTPPVSAMFSPPNARMQSFSPASASAPLPTLSSSQSYTESVKGGMEECQTTASSSEKHAFSAPEQGRSTGRDSWISDVPQFTLPRAAGTDKHERHSQQPQERPHQQPSPPQADLGLYQEDLLSDSEHGGKDGSISPVTYPPRRDSL
jgi:hypothetical protein